MRCQRCNSVMPKFSWTCFLTLLFFYFLPSLRPSVSPCPLICLASLREPAAFVKRSFQGAPWGKRQLATWAGLMPLSSSAALLSFHSAAVLKTPANLYVGMAAHQWRLKIKGDTSRWFKECSYAPSMRCLCWTKRARLSDWHILTINTSLDVSNYRHLLPPF